MMEQQTTENFWTRNVKLITFLVCVAVFLAVFLPIAGLELRDYFFPKQKPELTATEVTELALRWDKISFDDLTAFRGETGESEVGDYFSATFGKYYLMVRADHRTHAVTYFVIYNTETERSVDATCEDVAAFFREN